MMVTSAEVTDAAHLHGEVEQADEGGWGGGGREVKKSSLQRRKQH